MGKARTWIRSQTRTQSIHRNGHRHRKTNTNRHTQSKSKKKDKERTRPLGKWKVQYHALQMITYLSS